MPVPGGTLPNQLHHPPGLGHPPERREYDGPARPTRRSPFDASLGGGSITLANPHGPRVGDLNGDGAEDVVLPLDGVFNVFLNGAPDEDCSSP